MKKKIVFILTTLVIVNNNISTMELHPKITQENKDGIIHTTYNFSVVPDKLMFIIEEYSNNNDEIFLDMRTHRGHYMKWMKITVDQAIYAISTFSEEYKNKNHQVQEYCVLLALLNDHISNAIKNK